MLTAAEFVALWPEFTAIYEDTPAIVEMAVAVAAALTDPEVFGSDVVTNRAQGLSAAHFLVSDPSGREARIKHDIEFTDVYLVGRQQLEAIHCSHWILPA